LVLLERQKLATQPYFYVGQCADERAQQRFEGILRNQVIGFERTAIVVGGDYSPFSGN
jgi:hypothetical protein